MKPILCSTVRVYRKKRVWCRGALTHRQLNSKNNKAFTDWLLAQIAELEDDGN